MLGFAPEYMKGLSPEAQALLRGTPGAASADDEPLMPGELPCEIRPSDYVRRVVTQLSGVMHDVLEKVVHAGLVTDLGYNKQEKRPNLLDDLDAQGALHVVKKNAESIAQYLDATPSLLLASVCKLIEARNAFAHRPFSAPAYTYEEVQGLIDDAGQLALHMKQDAIYLNLDNLCTRFEKHEDLKKLRAPVPGRQLSPLTEADLINLRQAEINKVEKGKSTGKEMLYWPLELNNSEYRARVVELLGEILRPTLMKLVENGTLRMPIHPRTRRPYKENELDAYQVLSTAEKYCADFAAYLGKSEEVIRVSLEHLVDVRNSFAHQRLGQGSHKKDVLKAISRAGHLAIAAKEDATYHRIDALKKRYKAHQEMRKQRGRPRTSRPRPDKQRNVAPGDRVECPLGPGKVPPLRLPDNQLYVPSDLSGYLLGKLGVHHKKLEKDFAVKLVINKCAVPNTDLAIVEPNGNAADVVGCVAELKRRLQKKVPALVLPTPREVVEVELDSAVIAACSGLQDQERLRIMEDFYSVRVSIVDRDPSTSTSFVIISATHEDSDVKGCMKEVRAKAVPMLPEPRSIQVEARWLNQLLGRGNSQVKALEQRFNVKIEVPKSDGADSVTVTLKAKRHDSDLEGCRAAIKRAEPPSPLQVVLFNVHTQNVGRIIGKGGATIQNLQQEFNVRIALPQSQWAPMVTATIMATHRHSDVAGCVAAMDALVAQGSAGNAYKAKEANASTAAADGQAAEAVAVVKPVAAGAASKRKPGPPPGPPKKCPDPRLNAFWKAWSSAAEAYAKNATDTLRIAQVDAQKAYDQKRAELRNLDAAAAAFLV